MNKDTLLIILLIAIIIIALFYLINNNNKENNALESFSQQNSLSTYYQQTVDANEKDDYYAKNKFNQFVNDTNINTNKRYWDGSWELTDVPSSLYFSFLHVNDQLIISISKQRYNLDTNTINKASDVCSPDTFVGIGSLNKSGKYFILNKIICDNLKKNLNDNNSISMTNKLFGYIDSSNLGLASLSLKYNNIDGLQYNSSLIGIKRITPVGFSYDLASSLYLYLSSFFSYINPIPLYTNSYNNDLDVCNNSSFTKGTKTYIKRQLTRCFISDQGLPIKEGDVGYSSYGTGCTEKGKTTKDANNNDICGNDTQTCFIASPGRNTVGNYTKCITDYDELDVCYNSSFNSHKNGDLKSCYIDNKSLPLKGEGENEYGTGCSKTISDAKTSKDIPYSKCSDDTSKTCLINMPTSSTIDTPINISGYTNCYTNFDITRKFNSNLNNGLYNTTEGICSYLNKFSNDNFNSAIIMYVSDLTNVQTLNYEYFGQGANKSNLTMQTDITTNFMEKILKKLRNFIKNTNTTETQLNTALSLTNCFESNDSSSTHSAILNTCKTWDTFTNTAFNNSTLNNVIPKDTITIKHLKPLIWKLKIDNQNSSSCTFSLSSSNLYKKENQWVKYVEFNSLKNKTNMSLYEGGTNQSIILENASIIDQNSTASGQTNGINDTYILVSGNLRSSNPKKYLIPSNVKSGFFNNSSTINLQNNVNNKGKWVILGFNLAPNSDLIGKITKDEEKESAIITTLRAIQAKM